MGGQGFPDNRLGPHPASYGGLGNIWKWGSKARGLGTLGQANPTVPQGLAGVPVTVAPPDHHRRLPSLANQAPPRSTRAAQDTVDLVTRPPRLPPVACGSSSGLTSLLSGCGVSEGTSGFDPWPAVSQAPRATWNMAGAR